jgi:hypothetical protein
MLNASTRSTKKLPKKISLAVSLKQAYLPDALSCDNHVEVSSLDDEQMLIFRVSKKGYDK